jgi:hypothetical protein
VEEDTEDVASPSKQSNVAGKRPVLGHLSEHSECVSLLAFCLAASIYPGRGGPGEYLFYSTSDNKQADSDKKDF